MAAGRVSVGCGEKQNPGRLAIQQTKLRPFFPTAAFHPPTSQPESGSLPSFPALPAPNPQEYIPFLLPQFLQVPTSHHFLLHALLAFAPAHTPCDVLRQAMARSGWLAPAVLWNSVAHQPKSLCWAGETWSHHWERRLSRGTLGMRLAGVPHSKSVQAHWGCNPG